MEGASKKMSDFKKSIENTRLGEWIGQLNDAPAELDAFNKSLSGTGIAAKAASVGMKVLSAAGNAAIGILIGTAVNLAINGLTWLAETEDRLLEKAQEATETYKSNSSSLEDYRARV